MSHTTSHDRSFNARLPSRPTINSQPENTTRPPAKRTAKKWRTSFIRRNAKLVSSLSSVNTAKRNIGTSTVQGVNSTSIRAANKEPLANIGSSTPVKATKERATKLPKLASKPIVETGDGVVTQKKDVSKGRPATGKQHEEDATQLPTLKMHVSATNTELSFAPCAMSPVLQGNTDQASSKQKTTLTTKSTTPPFIPVLKTRLVHYSTTNLWTSDASGRGNVMYYQTSAPRRCYRQTPVPRRLDSPNFSVLSPSLSVSKINIQKSDSESFGIDSYIMNTIDRSSSQFNDQSRSNSTDNEDHYSIGHVAMAQRQVVMEDAIDDTCYDKLPGGKPAPTKGMCKPELRYVSLNSDRQPYWHVPTRIAAPSIRPDVGTPVDPTPFRHLLKSKVPIKSASTYSLLTNTPYPPNRLGLVTGTSVSLNDSSKRFKRGNLRTTDVENKHDNAGRNTQSPALQDPEPKKPPPSPLQLPNITPKTKAPSIRSSVTSPRLRRRETRSRFPRVFNPFCGIIHGWGYGAQAKDDILVRSNLHSIVTQASRKLLKSTKTCMDNELAEIKRASSELTTIARAQLLSPETQTKITCEHTTESIRPHHLPDGHVGNITLDGVKQSTNTGSIQQSGLETASQHTAQCMQPSIDTLHMLPKKEAIDDPLPQSSGLTTALPRSRSFFEYCDTTDRKQTTSPKSHDEHSPVPGRRFRRGTVSPSGRVNGMSPVYPGQQDHTDLSTPTARTLTPVVRHLLRPASPISKEEQIRQINLSPEFKASHTPFQQHTRDISGQWLAGRGDRVATSPRHLGTNWRQKAKNSPAHCDLTTILETGGKLSRGLSYLATVVEVRSPDEGDPNKSGMPDPLLLSSNSNLSMCKPNSVSSSMASCTTVHVSASCCSLPPEANSDTDMSLLEEKLGVPWSNRASPQLTDQRYGPKWDIITCPCGDASPTPSNSYSDKETDQDKCMPETSNNE